MIDNLFWITIIVWCFWFWWFIYSKFENKRAWQHLIDYKLITLGDLSDENIEPPTNDIIQIAISIAIKFRDINIQAPNDVHQDVNGGIIFEYHNNNIEEIIYIWDDGDIEYQYFYNSHLIQRLFFIDNFWLI